MSPGQEGSKGTTTALCAGQLQFFPLLSVLEKEDAAFYCLVLQTVVTRVSAHLN